MIMAWQRSNQTSKRLICIPGVGPLLATALVASVADPKVFRSGRNFSAWIGLVPKQHSSGGRARLGSISKQGGQYLRGLFVAAHSPSSGGEGEQQRASETGRRIQSFRAQRGDAIATDNAVQINQPPSVFGFERLRHERRWCQRNWLRRR